MAVVNSELSTHQGSFHTERKDIWWVEPVFTVSVLILFGIYATWAAVINKDYEFHNYLSPFFSPDLKAMFPQFPWAGISPAFLILWIPLGFRGTCYFYRRAYYRSFFWDPPACAVGEARHHDYKGETAWPFIFSNLHRYFLYAAIVLAIFQWVHVINAFNFNGQFGVGLGSVVIFLDALFLTLYVCSCHSLRHLIGGKLDCFSCSKMNQVRHGIWGKLSKLNEHHMFYAWVSLFAVGLADLYVRLLATGTIQDIRFF